jgi:hypothetical protein
MTAYLDLTSGKRVLLVAKTDAVRQRRVPGALLLYRCRNRALRVPFVSATATTTSNAPQAESYLMQSVA